MGQDNTFIAETSFTPAATAAWSLTDFPFLLQREAGLAAASKGALAAHCLRATEAVEGGTGWMTADFGLSFFYVLRGTVVLATADGLAQMLVADDAVTLPPGCDYEWRDFSDGFEALEITASELVAAVPPGPAPIVHLGAVEDFVGGAGDRTDFTYRDFGFADLTGDRLRIRVIRPIRQQVPATGWHAHTMGQFAFGIRGWAHVDFPGRPRLRLGVGDGLTVAAGTAHDAGDHSADFAMIDICLPATYSTTAVPNPA